VRTHLHSFRKLAYTKIFLNKKMLKNLHLSKFDPLTPPLSIHIINYILKDLGYLPAPPLPPGGRLNSMVY